MKRLANNANPVRIAIALDGKVTCDSNRLNARKRREAARDIAEQGNLLFGLGVGGIRRDHLHAGEMRCVEAEVNMKEAIETFAQQPGANQQDYGYSQFDDDEVGSHATPESARCGAATVAETCADVLEGETKNGRDGHERSREKGDGR